jgi:L-alanine-DL-glutamate epimerase-like enolase superfamily enzyme
VRIAEVEAVWLHCPLEAATQHVSDFGRIRSFDSVLVTIIAEDGLHGYGEAKAGVGSAADCAALVALIREDLRPRIVGQDARHVQRLWSAMYDGPRAEYALRSGRRMPVLGRRGLHLCGMSGVDLALWDLLGKSLGQPVLTLLGGACRDRMPVYASGGWADERGIGEELTGYLRGGFRAVKMRVGAMDGAIETSLARVRAARAAVGPAIALMADAHGTLSAAEAKRFCAEVAGLGLRWIEEPVGPDDRDGAAEVRRATAIPIAAGESETTCHEFLDLLRRGAVDVLQPDLAICGGLTEGLRIAALAVAHQRELAPHCWGSAISYVAALTLAASCPAGVFVEWPMGGNPLLRELPRQNLSPRDGHAMVPEGPGWGLDLDPAVIARYAKKP